MHVIIVACTHPLLWLHVWHFHPHISFNMAVVVSCHIGGVAAPALAGPLFCLAEPRPLFRAREGVAPQVLSY